MNVELIDSKLDEWTLEEEDASNEAEAAGDERGKSLALMKKNMYETMLRTLAHKAPAKLKNCADEMSERARKFEAFGDYDSADRCRIQRVAIERVMGLLEETGKNDE